MEKIIINGVEYPYLIDREGNVYNIKFNRKMSLSNRAGYPTLHLSKDGKSIKIALHIVLAKTFIPNPENKPLVRHLNDIKSDWRLENLAWGDDKDNARDAIRNGKNINGSYNPNSKLTNDIVKYLYINPNNKTNKELSDEFGICNMTIWSIRSGKSWRDITKNLTR